MLEGTFVNHTKNKETEKIPVIIVLGEPELYDPIADVGAIDIVLKPFEESTLLQQIERQLLN